MKAEDLMIGDYCRVWREGLCIKNKGTVVKVLGIDAENRLEEKDLVGCAHCHPLDGQFDGGIWCEYLDPIPLTVEFLEKNTSESNKNVFGGMNYALNADFFVENRGDRFCLSRRMAGHKYSTFWICDIHYVHELQHALRLCGITLDIKV